MPVIPSKSNIFMEAFGVIWLPFYQVKTGGQTHRPARLSIPDPVEVLMSKYFAFLRAINVGGHTIKMEALRNLFEECGFTRVETFIASGNVIFETDSHNSEELTKIIEAHLLSELGFGVAVFLRTPRRVNRDIKP